MKNTFKGALVAFAVASLFGCNKGGDTQEATGNPTGDEATETATTTGDATADLVQCAGVNECKGQGACAAADGSHSCAGNNECKGKGWIKLSEADCTAQGGMIVPND